jgi:hypothetical protein
MEARRIDFHMSTEDERRRARAAFLIGMSDRGDASFDQSTAGRRPTPTRPDNHAGECRSQNSAGGCDRDPDWI